MRRSAVSIAIVVAVLAGCQDAGHGPPHLSDWGLFADAAAQVPAEGVIPYEVISPLFSDYANKHRFIRLPEGGQITYTAGGDDFEYPIGTVLVKTFGYLHDLRDPSAGERLVETRLMVREDDGRWHPYVYLWNDDMSGADLMQVGARVDVEWIHSDGEMRTLRYRVPNAVQCRNCHGGRDETSPIGPRGEQLDRDNDFGDGPENQIDHMVNLGLFANDVPAFDARQRLADPMGDGPLYDRGRAYLDANCSHCHNERGPASQSGLWLGAHIDDEDRLGFCKVPAAAGDTGGRHWDVVPSAPDDSLMIYRMSSEVPGTKMPELPALLSHTEGVALMREWIGALPARTCQ